MNLFLTESTGHLRRLLVNRGATVSSARVVTFADGERAYRLQEDVKRQTVRLVASILADPTSLFDLLCTFRLLRDNRAHNPSLVIPYLGYARQDRAVSGEMATGVLVAELIRNLNASRVAVLDPHSSLVTEALGPEAKSISAIPLIAAHFASRELIDLIIAPDSGARERAEALAGVLPGNPSVAWIEKTRPKPNVAVAKALHGTVKGKHVLLIDDMIDTGGTMIEAAKLVSSKGAASIRLAATHGLFSKDARDKLARLPIQEIVVTNSLEQERHPSVHVIDISPLLLP